MSDGAADEGKKYLFLIWVLNLFSLIRVIMKRKHFFVT